jgi:hypothetical protein
VLAPPTDAVMVPGTADGPAAFKLLCETLCVCMCIWEPHHHHQDSCCGVLHTLRLRQPVCSVTRRTPWRVLLSSSERILQRLFAVRCVAAVGMLSCCTSSVRACVGDHARRVCCSGQAVAGSATRPALSCNCSSCVCVCVCVGLCGVRSACRTA